MNSQTARPLKLITSLERLLARSRRDFSREGITEVVRSGFSGIFVNGGSGIGPDMIPPEALAETDVIEPLFPITGQFAREDVAARSKLAAENGAAPWVYIWGVAGPDESRDSCFADIMNYADRRTKLEMRAALTREPEIFGHRDPKGPNWRGSRPLCLSNPKVQRFYEALAEQLPKKVPGLEGVIFFPGDHHAECCDEHCAVCGATSKDSWERIIEHSNRMQESLIRSGSDVTIYFAMWNMSWRNEQVDRVKWFTERLHPKSGFCISFSDDITVERRGNTFQFFQPWSNMSEPGNYFEELYRICGEQDRKMLVFAELCQSEVWDPVCHNFPLPLKVLQLLRNLERFPKVEGVLDFWGHRSPYLPHANLAVVRAYRAGANRDDADLLKEAASDHYGVELADKGLIEACLGAWTELDRVVDNWNLTCWGQRFSNSIGRVGARGSYYYPLLPDMFRGKGGVNWMTQGGKIDANVFCKNQLEDRESFLAASRAFEDLAVRMAGGGHAEGARIARREGTMVALAGEMIGSMGRAARACHQYAEKEFEALRATILEEILARRRALDLSAKVGPEAGVPDYYVEEDIQLMSYYLSHEGYPELDLAEVGITSCPFTL